MTDQLRRWLEAAAAHGVPQAAIAKTLSLTVGGRPFLLVDRRPRAARQQQGQGAVRRQSLHARPRRGAAPHQPSGRRRLPVRACRAAAGLLRCSLKEFAEVVPAAGSTTARCAFHRSGSPRWRMPNGWMSAPILRPDSAAISQGYKSSRVCGTGDNPRARLDASIWLICTVPRSKASDSLPGRTAIAARGPRPREQWRRPSGCSSLSAQMRHVLA